MGRRLSGFRAIAAATLVATPVAAAPLHKPQHVLSLNQCNDLLLLMLVPKQRIASITTLAHPLAAALLPGSDVGVAVNRGSAEEILLQRPDLILASPWSTPLARVLARQAGIPLVEVEAATDFDGIRRTMRQVGAAVGEPERAEIWLRAMDRELARLPKLRPPQPLRVAVWDSSGMAPGRGSLTDAIVTAAGGIDIASKATDERATSFGMEELLAARPDAIIQASARPGIPALRQQQARWPLLDRLYRGRIVDLPDSATSCGLPQAAWAATRLAQALAAVPRGGPRW